MKEKEKIMKNLLDMLEEANENIRKASASITTVREVLKNFKDEGER